MALALGGVHVHARSGQVPAGQQVVQRALVHDATPHEVDQIGAALHRVERRSVDQVAGRVLERVLEPGGHAVVSVPLRLDAPTHEDPSVTDPEERARLFGERSHVRWYGIDLIERLEAPGFEVRLDRASDVPTGVRDRSGLRADENVFLCHKPRHGHSR